MKRICYFFIIFCFIISAFDQCYALNWKFLHEYADRISFSKTKVEIDKDLSVIEKLYILGLMHLNKHQDDLAEAAFRSIAGLEPDNMEANWGLAEVLRRKRSLDESEKLIGQVIKKDPQFWPAYITLSYIKYTRQDFQGAVNLATKVVRQGRESMDLSNFTRSYLIIGGAKGMIANRGGPIAKVLNGLQVLPNLKKAVQLQPDSAEVLFGLGSFYFLAPLIAGGHRDKAKQYLERTIEADPLFVDAYVRLAQLHKMQGDLEKSKIYFEEAIKIDPENTLVQDFKSGKCRFACISTEE